LHGVVVLVPAFQYSNIYRPTPKLALLAKSLDVQRRAIEKCSRSELKKAKIRDILMMFASMTHGATLGELCVRFDPAKYNIDERKTVLFGLIEQLIRPIYKYPISLEKNLFVGYEEESKGISFDISSGIPKCNLNKRYSIDSSAQVTKSSFTGLKTLGELSRSECLMPAQALTRFQLTFSHFLSPTDEICMRAASSTREIEEQLANDKHVIVLLK